MSTVPQNPQLLARLEAMASMFRHGGPIWIVASESSAEDASEADDAYAFQSAEAAGEAVEALNADGRTGFDVYGPYQTYEDSDEDRGLNIRSVRIEFEDGRTEEIDLEFVDAIFLTRSALEKFAMPYVSNTYGQSAAEGWLAGLQGERLPCCHRTSKGPGHKPCFKQGPPFTGKPQQNRVTLRTERARPAPAS